MTYRDEAIALADKVQAQLPEPLSLIAYESRVSDIEAWVSDFREGIEGELHGD